MSACPISRDHAFERGDKMDMEDGYPLPGSMINAVGKRKFALNLVKPDRTPEIGRNGKTNKV